MALREPIGEIEHDAGEESRLGNAQDEPQRVKAQRPLYERAGGRDCAPAAEDDEYPAPRAHALEHEIRRHLEDQIADEEQARAEAEDRGREREILVHGERGEADIQPVDDADEIEQRHQRYEPPRGLGEDLLAHVSKSLSFPAEAMR